jgi:hypothetical protein
MLLFCNVFIDEDVEHSAYWRSKCSRLIAVDTVDLRSEILTKLTNHVTHDALVTWFFLIHYHSTVGVRGITQIVTVCVSIAFAALLAIMAVEFLMM